MDDMFHAIRLLVELDVSSFDTHNVTDMKRMFCECNNLGKIYASGNFYVDAVSDSSLMFDNDTALVGGNGTAYDSGHTDKTYARVDTASTPGYFTLR